MLTLHSHKPEIEYLPKVDTGCRTLLFPHSDDHHLIPHSQEEGNLLFATMFAGYSKSSDHYGKQYIDYHTTRKFYFWVSSENENNNSKVYMHPYVH